MLNQKFSMQWNILHLVWYVKKLRGKDQKLYHLKLGFEIVVKQ